MSRRILAPGRARGEVLVLDEPLSFWGGVDGETGRVIEAGHPQFGQSVEGKILVMAHGRGSSSSSSVLAELLRIGRGPAGIVLSEPDSILVIGSLVASSLYGAECPIVIDRTVLETGAYWEID